MENIDTNINNNWAYQNYMRWGKQFPKCNGIAQTPINIDDSKIKECNETCNLTARYINSKCFISNNNKTPIIRVSSGNYIKFRDILYELNKITVHTPSMHTINGDLYDMEICLYHCQNASDCNTSGGVALSVLFQRGSAESTANYFLSQFVNKIPVEETTQEIDVKVNADWSPELVLPPTKSFYYYKGSLPNPPCNENWTWIVFEDIQTIDETAIEIIENTFKDNSRPVQPLGNRSIYYNANTNFYDKDEYQKQKIIADIKELVKISNNLKQKPAKSPLEIDNLNNSKSSNSSNSLVDSIYNNKTSYVSENKTLIRSFFITVIMIIMIFIAYKLAKHIIFTGILTRFMEERLRNAPPPKTPANKSQSQPNLSTNINNN